MEKNSQSNQKKKKVDKMNIRILVLDVDGTLTDGRIYMANSGEFMKTFDIKDGYGINDILPLSNIIPVIITGRKSQIVENRCKELKIKHVYQGVKDKIKKLDKLLEQYSLTYENVAYMGDDINDLPCMNIVAISACPRNAAKKVVNIVDYISEKDGGDGAVRDFIDWLCEE